MAAQSKTVIQAVAITATICLIIAAIVFYFLYKFMTARRLKKTGLDSSFRREAVMASPPMEFRQHGGAIKGLIVDEEGLDVLYVRKLEQGHLSGCFSKVWYNPMEEVEKRMDSRGEKPLIQEIPLLQESQFKNLPFPVNGNPLPISARKGPPSPPPTPENQTPPPPPPPPPLPPLKPPPPPPPPGPPKLKPAPPPAPVKSRGLVSSHKPPIPSKIKDLSKEKTNENGVQTKLKPLHWDKVTANADHSMVWNEINDGSFRFDDELMETLFGYNNISQKTSQRNNKLPYQGSSSSSVPAQIFILDPRKSQNTAIVLKSLAISRDEILDALLEGRGLNADMLEKLTKVCPTQDEINKILNFNGNPTKLAYAECFLYHILRAVPSAFIRFNAMLFRSIYDPEILHLKESLQVLELGCKELRSGGIFFKLLEAILKAGNKMNAGTNRGNAQGFNLTALRRLSDVKSTNGKTTLLHFVVEQVVRAEGKRCLINRNVKSGGISDSGEKYGETFSETNQQTDSEHLMLGLPVMESLNTEFANVKIAANIDYDSLINMCSILTTRVDQIKQTLTRCRDIESGRFLREMKGFLEDCEEELNVVREEEKRVMEIVRKTTVYYQAGSPKDKGGNPLQLYVIVKDFLKNVDQVCVEIAKKLEKRKVGTSAGSSPPLSPTPRSPVRFQNLQRYFRAQKPGTSSSDSEDDF